MSHYSDNPRSVRVDFFKESGKWYETEAVVWTGAYEGSKQRIHDAFKTSLADHFRPALRFRGMTAICLEPYHEHSHPISVKVDDAVSVLMREKDGE